MKKKRILKNLESDLKSGLIGLKISLFILIIIALLMIIYLSQEITFSEIISILFKMPSKEDYFAIFGFFIIFILTPFVAAIKLNRK